MSSTHYECLANGTEVAIRSTNLCELVYIQCWVGVGSLDEGDGERGLSHFLEHMLFKGTTKRKVGEIAQDVERMGGDINAYTSFDHTVFHLSLAKQHFTAGVELLADAIFESSLDADELAKEKEVVLEEIRRSFDDPSFLLGEKSFERIFAGCEAGRPIFGTQESVMAFTRETVLKFYKKWYQPWNFKVVVVGDVDLPSATQIVNAQFSRPNETPSAARNKHAIKTLEQIAIDIIYGDYQQPRLEFSFQAPTYFDSASIHLDLSAHALGAGDGSRLSRKIRDEKNLATSIGSSCYTPEFAGIFNVSAFLLADKCLEAITAISEELFAMKYLDPLTEDELDRARANIKTDYCYQEETIEGQARGLGFGLATPYKQFYDDVYFAKVNQVLLQDLSESFSKWIKEDSLAVTLLLPDAMKGKITEGQVQSAYLSGVRLVKEKLQKLSRKKASPLANTSREFKSNKEEIVPGIHLCYRRDEATKFFSLCAVKHGGLRAEDEETAGIYNAIAQMLGRANKHLDFDGLVGQIERHGALMDGFSGKDSLGFRLQCLSEHREVLLKSFFDCLREPVFPENQWRSVKLEILDDIRANSDHPASQCYRELQRLVFGEHPYFQLQLGTIKSVEPLTAAKLKQRYLSDAKKAPWVLACIGQEPYADVKELAMQHVEGWKLSTDQPTFASEKLAAFIPKAETLHIPKKREQTHVAVAVKGICWSDPDRYVLELLNAILSGQGGRLFMELRDKRSLAYTVTSMCSFGVHPGLFGAYIASAPEKAKEALGLLKEQLFCLLETPPNAEEIDRAKNSLIGSHASETQRTMGLVMNMSLMELYGVGFDEFQRYSKLIASVTSEDLLRVSRRLLQKEHLVEVSVGSK